MSALVYLFYPNPGNAYYSSPKALTLMIVCAVLVLGSFLVRYLRRGWTAKLRQLSRSWPSAAFWFGISGLVLVVARVEQIQYVAMRFLWVVWIAALGLYVFLQLRLFKARYYEVLPSAAGDDPREKYLPKKRK
jgi:hypothetical protein